CLSASAALDFPQPSVGALIPMTGKKYSPSGSLMLLRRGSIFVSGAGPSAMSFASFSLLVPGPDLIALTSAQYLAAASASGPSGSGMLSRCDAAAVSVRISAAQSVVETRNCDQ